MRIELSVQHDFLDLLSATGGIFYGDISSSLVKAISTDSRECMEGDIFFALEGKTFNGNDYIPEAISRGAIPVGRNVGRYGIRVNSGTDALLSFASFYKSTLPNLIHTIAITGSVGKTTTKDFLKILSSKRYKTHANRENFNNDIGTSITVLSADIDTEVLILELGMNHSGEIKRLSSTFNPNIGVITKIGTAHIGLLGTIENIAKAKLEIIAGLNGKLLIPFADSLLSTEYPNIGFFSSRYVNADTAVIKNSFNQGELYFNQHLFSIFDLPCKANHILECLSAAVAAASEIGISPGEIVDGINKIHEESFRHKTLQSKYGYTVIDDAYNASYESVIAALEMIQYTYNSKRRMILLGDILELGNMSHDIHYTIGKMIPKFDIDYIFLIGESSTSVALGAIDVGFDKKHIFILNNLEFPNEVSRFIKSMLSKGDLLLIKASHRMNFKKIAELII